MSRSSYDVIIVGGGIAGCTLAHGLSTLPRTRPLRIALVERSLAEPDRIVGELLQPGGVLALRQLGMGGCLDEIDAIPVDGYCIFDAGKSVHIPYPDGTVPGRSFHHGRFIMRLREAARRSEGVEVIEGTVSELVETAGRVVGVKVTKKPTVEGGEGDKLTLAAGVTIIADGCFSNFRNVVMGSAAAKPVTKSHFFGAVLEDARLPIPHHGTVCLVKGFGPVLMYQIGQRDTRILVDLKQPLPADPKATILENILPQLPSSVHIPIQNALEKDRLRRMPNSFLPPVQQGTRRTKAGAILIGDAWNMRHPLTGGGMTVALNDVVVLRDLLGSVDDLGEWSQVKRALHRWHWDRKPLASTINILSVALYDLFGADDEALQVLRTGCFKYFERGGDCINGPVSLLAGIAPDPVLLASHFFAVAFYAIYCIFFVFGFINITNIDINTPMPKPEHPLLPTLTLKAARVFYTACVVFGPLLWTEVRWWASPSYGSSLRTQLLLGLVALVPVVLLSVGMQAQFEAVGLDLSSLNLNLNYERLNGLPRMGMALLGVQHG